MAKRVVDESLYGKKTTFSKIANLISLLSVVGIVLYVIITWKNIPDMIPGNYNIAGEISYMTFQSIGGGNLHSMSVFVFLVLVFGGMAVFLVKVFKNR